MALRFAGLELDQQRAELRGRDGEILKLRPKALAMLSLFATNPGRVVTKQELMDTVWPDVHVGEDSLFQCIREIRTALGDDRRELIRLVSGQGYLFATAVTDDPPPTLVPDAETPAAPTAGVPETVRPSVIHRYRVLLSLAGLAAVLVLVAAIVWSGTVSIAGPPTIAVAPFNVEGAEDVSVMATNVAARLLDGLAKINNIRVILPQAAATQKAEFVVTADLRKAVSGWDTYARLTRVSTGEIVWSAHIAIAATDGDLELQQTRLVAGIGYPLALRLNEILDTDGRPAATDGVAKAAIEQATAAIKQTSRERFATAESILKRTIADDEDNVDIAVALAALQLRGIQMSWYPPAEGVAAEANSKSILKHALHIKPTSIAVLEAYCRMLSATNEFADSLVACARVLDFEPWDGTALFNLGLGQLQLGLFEDALATFKRAYSYDTPEVSRWTWQLGIGWVYGLMGQPADALPWVERSIAITPASGRSIIYLAGVYESLGRHADAVATMQRGMALRPGSTAVNIINPTKNATPVFLKAQERLLPPMIAAGLPAN